MNNNRDNVTANIEKFHEAILSSAHNFRTRGAYGSFEKALAALERRKPIVKSGFGKIECEKCFRIALKVVDDSLEFENNYVRSDQVRKSSSGWIDRETIEEVGRKMEKYLKDKNPDAPSIFIARSVGRIYYYYHLA